MPRDQLFGSGTYKAALRSRPLGHCHPRARWTPLRSYGSDAGRRVGNLRHPLAIHLGGIIVSEGGPLDGAVVMVPVPFSRIHCLPPLLLC